MRLRSTLEDAGREWSSIEPEIWVTERNYQERDGATELARFQELRRANLAWLGALEAPDWSCAYEHESLGAISAGELFTAWAAHDQLHLRQIVQRRFQLIEAGAAPYTARYAGKWPDRVPSA